MTSLMARSLGLPPGHFSSFYDCGFWGLRAIHYPRAVAADATIATTAATHEQRAAAGPELGCGVHTDYGCLTLLHSGVAFGVGYPSPLSLRRASTHVRSLLLASMSRYLPWASW